MTREEVLAMKAGRGLDGLVAKEIMGIEVEYPYAEGFPYYLVGEKGKKVWDAVVFYSTDITAAWQVVDKLVSEYYEFRLMNIYHHGRRRWCWYCGFEAPEDLGEGYFSIEVDTAPEAICKVALLAKLAEKEIEKE